MQIGANGQFLQDDFVFNFFHPTLVSGTFLDIGAGVGGLKPVLNRPGFYSNTYLLEKLEWKGLCIDFDQRWCDYIRPFRDMIVCEDLMQTNINKVLEKFNMPSHINYLSFDVDDAQEKVFSELDFDKYSFDVVTYEHNLFQSYPDCDQNHPLEYRNKVKKRHAEDKLVWEKLGYVPFWTNVGEVEGRPVEDWYVSEKIYDQVSDLAKDNVITKSEEFRRMMQELGKREVIV